MERERYEDGAFCGEHGGTDGEESSAVCIGRGSVRSDAGGKGAGGESVRGRNAGQRICKIKGGEQDNGFFQKAEGVGETAPFFQ